jgi:hypothetical protein
VSYLIVTSFLIFACVLQVSPASFISRSPFLLIDVRAFLGHPHSTGYRTSCGKPRHSRGAWTTSMHRLNTTPMSRHLSTCGKPRLTSP